MSLMLIKIIILIEYYMEVVYVYDEEHDLNELTCADYWGGM